MEKLKRGSRGAVESLAATYMARAYPGEPFKVSQDYHRNLDNVQTWAIVRVNRKRYERINGRLEYNAIHLGYTLREAEDRLRKMISAAAEKGKASGTR